MKRGICILGIGLALAIHAAPPFVTPAMIKRNGLTDEQYEMLWKQGKNPQIDVATARDWIFRASRYTNVVEWLEVCGKTNDFARLSHKLQGDNFALVESNTAQRVEIRRLDALASNFSNAWEYAESEASAFSNRWNVAEARAALAEKRAERLDALRTYLVEQRDKAVLPTTKAIYQALIDMIDAKEN